MYSRAYFPGHQAHILKKSMSLALFAPEYNNDNGWKNKKMQWTFDNYVNLRHLEVIGIMKSDRIEDGKFISIKPLSLGIWRRCFRKF